MVRKTKFLTSLTAKALVVAVTAGGGLLIGGVAYADTPGGSQNTGTGSSNGGLLGGTGGLGQVVGSVLDPILGGGSGGTGGLGQVVKPILDPVLGGGSGGTGGLGLGQLLTGLGL